MRFGANVFSVSLKKLFLRVLLLRTWSDWSCKISRAPAGRMERELSEWLNLFLEEDWGMLVVLGLLCWLVPAPLLRLHLVAISGETRWQRLLLLRPVFVKQLYVL